ncbi:MAG: TiaS agmantine-binding domain-containing protein [Candidatus Heimdallarchaeota archaeon]
MKKVLHIGIDDTDSLKGSCTTHLATTIVTEIAEYVSFLDLPNLIRLNPNIPYKTRGNGAVAIRIIGEQKDLQECKEITIKTTEKLARFEDENTNPGIAFLMGEISGKLKAFSKQALWDVLSIAQAEMFQENAKIDLLKYGNGRGIIGALAAIGNLLEEDFTYEHLSYRHPKNYGTKRAIDEQSVYKADKATPLTFNNIDYEYNSVLITPRGADPVFSGIRGETVKEVLAAWELLEPLEPIVMQMVFRTNQHTNQHLFKRFKINQLKAHQAIITSGVVSRKPRYIPGRHLIFSLKDETGEIDCAAYEPTKRFRNIMNQLLVGDELEVSGGVRPAADKHPLTINLERVRIIKLIEDFKKENPFCDQCGARLKSAGKNKGFKCFKCSAVYRNKKVIQTERPRKITIGEYIPPAIAHRHLTKPQVRMGRDNTGTQLSERETNALLAKLIEFNRANNKKR